MILELTNGKISVPELRIDNLSVIRLIKNPDIHQRSKHIDIKFCFIRERYKSKDIQLRHVDSAIQEADIFTRSLGKQKFQELRELIGVKEM